MAMKPKDGEISTLPYPAAGNRDDDDDGKSRGLRGQERDARRAKRDQERDQAQQARQNPQGLGKSARKEAKTANTAQTPENIARTQKNQQIRADNSANMARAMEQSTAARVAANLPLTGAQLKYQQGNSSYFGVPQKPGAAPAVMPATPGVTPPAAPAMANPATSSPVMGGAFTKPAAGGAPAMANPATSSPVKGGAFKKGGSISKSAAPARRGDGIAQRGKTKGRMV